MWPLSLKIFYCMVLTLLLVMKWDDKMPTWWDEVKQSEWCRHCDVVLDIDLLTICQEDQVILDHWALMMSMVLCQRRWCQGWGSWEGHSRRVIDFITSYSEQFKTYKLFICGNVYLIFWDQGWLGPKLKLRKEKL